MLFCQFSIAQIVINELDCDTPSTDTQEFLELKSDTPNFPLDGYVVVFFNGSTSGMNSSYFTIDLDGYTTDVNGLLLIGSNSVSPVPQLLISESVIQNGADAVAIYQASWFDFPNETVAHITDLIDVLIYDTSDADDLDLIDIFNDHPNFTDIQQINEDENGNKDNESIQRNNDGTYTVTTPTPRQLNDGSGIVLNGITISIDEVSYNEGDNFDITFTTEQNVTDPLNFDILLDNGTFTASDFTGNTSMTIPTGQNTISTTITLVDDTDDEGDEVMSVRFQSLPTEFLELNNNIEVRVVDNDYTVAPFGTPLSPTYGNVSSTQPMGYYDSLDGLSGAALKQAMQDIVANPSIVRAQTYTDVIDILKEADQNPLNSNQVWLLYVEEGRAKLDFQTTSENLGKWNREHTFPRSRGGFDSIEADDTSNGVDIYWTTEADSLRHANSDAHGIRAADGPENSIRSNQHYGQYVGPTGNAGSFYGDVARSVLFLEIRYNGLEVVNGFPDTVGQMGDLATLLTWHRNDPPDDFEMNRNNVIYTWQFNRNPLIDYPDLVEYIWGNMVGEVWSQPLSVEDKEALQVKIYPNPTTRQVFFSGLQNEAEVIVFSIEGRKLKAFNVENSSYIDLQLSSGMYMLHILTDGKSTTQKIIIK